jgi:hypothetical protein
VSSAIIIVYCVLVTNSSYNPIPIGSVIISTTRTISVLQPREYGGADRLTIIFTANKTMIIVNTIFDPRSRELYIIFTNPMTNILYLSQLKSMEKLHRITHELPISYNISYLNKLTSFSSDITNKRGFFTDNNGQVTMFSMGGSMKMTLSTPMTITKPIRSVNYNEKLNRLFLITDSTVNSCTNLDQNNLKCCSALPKTDQLRSIAFDRTTMNSFAYVIDELTGIYQVVLNSVGCPMALRPIDAMDSYQNTHLKIHQRVYFASGSNDHSNHNSILIIGNGTQTPRTIPFDASIVAIHISYPSIKPAAISDDQVCFHGITYHDYRVAVVLAAIFGTIMGIFMCFNALFCIDFFMTQEIIRELKKQIPRNLLEDRWNKLIQEKYAKLALAS